MCDFVNWSRDDPERRKANESFDLKLQSYSELFSDLNIFPLPDYLYGPKEVSLQWIFAVA